MVARAVSDTGWTTPYLVRIEGRGEHGCETPEDVSRLVSEYQMEHADDPDLNGISIVAPETGRTVPPKHFLPQQLP